MLAALVVGMLTAALPSHAFNSSYYQVTGPSLFWNLTNPPVSISTNVVNPGTRAIRFFLASDAYSPTNKTNELNAIRASFAQWQSIPGSIIKFEEAGLVPPRGSRPIAFPVRPPAITMTRACSRPTSKRSFTGTTRHLPC